MESEAEAAEDRIAELERDEAIRERDEAWDAARVLLEAFEVEIEDAPPAHHSTDCARFEHGNAEECDCAIGEFARWYFPCKREEESDIMESEIERLKRERDEALELLQRAANYIGYASCHGDKCRLPHCHDCNMEPDIDGLDAVLAAIDAARKGEGC